MLQTALQAAKEAGKIMMRHYGKVTPQYKDHSFGPGSVVTKADLEIEEKIVSFLEKKFPDHNIFAEEKTKKDKKSNYTWSLDPIDGTSNFVRNIPLFGISLGLLYKKEPILGVIFLPALKTLVHAEKGKGCFVNGKKVSVSKRALKEALYFGRIHNLASHEKLGKQIALCKIIQASSYELVQIAQGNAEIYATESVLHDVAAGVILIREAGGQVTDYEGKPWDASSKTIVATNGIIHKKVLSLLQH
ncbi:inositol monophosphatase [Candidatus Woesearchaeota archaeon]|nr:inositol monophosphatase [Candidatus Woesearchaeota archaeon]